MRVVPSQPSARRISCSHSPSSGAGGVDREVVEDEVVGALGPHHQRHLVDVVDVARREHRLLGDAGEQRDLPADLTVEPALGAADQRVRLDPDAAQLVDRVLGRLGLHLAGVADVGDQGQVQEHAALRAQVRVELADCLQERQRLDVADRAPDLGATTWWRPFCH